MSATSGHYRVRVARFQDLDGPTLESWRALENRALEANAYLSPQFVTAAVRHLASPPASRQPFLVLVETPGRGPDRLVGLGIFERRSWSRRFPLPHLEAYRSLHSYRSGILVDRGHAAGVIGALFRFFQQPQATWHAVAFDEWLCEGDQATLLMTIARGCGGQWFPAMETSRAILVPREGGERQVAAALSRYRLKKLRQARRHLETCGPVAWRALAGEQVDDGAIGRFLELEHMGRKGEQGTSLRSRPEQEAFFREMAEGFRREGRLFFTELTIGQAIVASTCNLISGRTGFAFKIGWDPRYAKGSPGILNEVEFVRAAPTLFAALDAVDSGASEGSFIEEIWTDRWALASGAFSTTPLGRTVLATTGRLRQYGRRAKALWRARCATTDRRVDGSDGGHPSFEGR
jgi:hypothetical protein